MKIYINASYQNLDNASKDLVLELIDLGKYAPSSYFYKYDKEALNIATDIICNEKKDSGILMNNMTPKMAIHHLKDMQDRITSEKGKDALSTAIDIVKKQSKNDNEWIL